MKFDSLYHDVFADTALTAMLLESFVPASIVAALDLETLTLLNSKNYTKDRRLRIGDLMFAVNYKNSSARMGVRIALEAQSAVDVWMPLRALEYALLHWNQVRLAHQKATRPSRRKSKAALPPQPAAATEVPELPAVISLVVFSGEKAYSAPTNLHDYIKIPKGAEAVLHFCPQIQQLVVNIKTLDAAFLAHRNNALTWFFELERAQNHSEAVTALKKLSVWARQPTHERFLNAVRYYIKEFSQSGQRQGSALTLYNAIDPKEEAMSIAENIDRAFDEREQIGQARGEALGEARGQARGEARGEARGKALMEQQISRETIKDMLELKFAAVGLQFWQEVIEKLELAPWRELRARVTAAQVPEDLVKIRDFLRQAATDKP